MNTKPTSEAILVAAVMMEDTAKELRHYAKQLEETGDFTYSSMCVNKIANLIPNLRLDLFVTRPIREYEREKNS